MADQGTTSIDWERASELVAKAWADEGFKQRLMSDPEAVLKEHGIPIPAGGAKVKVVENTDDVRHLVIPARPKTTELSEAQLAGVAGGVTLATQQLQFNSLKSAAVGAFAERAVCALWSPARIR
jgi:hypothetical protein